LEVNRVAARAKLARVWRLLGLESARGDDDAVSRLIAHVCTLCDRLAIKTSLREYGVAAEKIGELLAFASGNSLKANPREFAPRELAELLAARV
jgi:alcohol dehydrogenase class IV